MFGLCHTQLQNKTRLRRNWSIALCEIARLQAGVYYNDSNGR